MGIQPMAQEQQFSLNKGGDVSALFGSFQNAFQIRAHHVKDVANASEMVNSFGLRFPLFPRILQGFHRD